MTRTGTQSGSAASVGRPVYLDYQATTPTDPRVVEAMLPFFTEAFGNPHSRSHAFGSEAAAAVEAARRQVADLVGAEAREIVFTSGATESNNLAIKGAARFHRGRGRDGVVTCTTEHKCVLESVRRLEDEGFRVSRIGVGADGLIDLEALAAAVDDRTAVVSVMAVNNETGVMQPIAEIGALCRARGAMFHSDAAQAAGKMPLDVNAMQIDLMSLSAHKMYGPKGIGALYLRRRPRARINPEMDGGGQERGFRSGTLPAPLCVGFGAAAAVAAAERAAEAERLLGMRRRLWDRIRSGVPDVRLNGHAERRIPGNLNLAFPGVDAEMLLARVRGLALSTGSACTSAAVEPSYVLRAMGLDADLAACSIRIGLGRGTTDADVAAAADAIVAAVRSIRAEEGSVPGTTAPM